MRGAAVIPSRRSQQGPDGCTYCSADSRGQGAGRAAARHARWNGGRTGRQGKAAQCRG